MCSLAQESGSCRLNRWLNSQRETFSQCLVCSSASLHGRDTEERGVRSSKWAKCPLVAPQEAGGWDSGMEGTTEGRAAEK